jgi:hypothetical protein
MAQCASIWQQVLSSKCEGSSSRSVSAIIVGHPSSGKKVIMGSLLGQVSTSFGANCGAPLLYGHSSLASTSECDVNLEVFAIGSNTQLLSMVLAKRSHCNASDLVFAICLDIALEDTCVHQCQQLIDDISKLWDENRAEAENKPGIVIFACKGDLLNVNDSRWDVISASLRLLALKCGAAFSVQSSPSGCATSRQIILAALKLASWPLPCPLRASFFVPPNHDSADLLRPVLEELSHLAPSLPSGSSKSLNSAPLKTAPPILPDEEQVRYARVLALV